jgi:hypothetical protein
MKYILYLAFFLLSYSVLGQCYISPLTQHFPSAITEPINRIINIDQNYITITTKTIRGDDIQTLKIIKKQLKQNSERGSMFYYTCTSLDGNFKTYIIIPKSNTVEYIDAVQPAQLNYSEKHFRFLIDSELIELM